MLRPFFYRKYLDFGAFDAIREMKRLIEREMKHRQTLDNIKLGWGGIREVEFLVQCHQLIRGGREKSLQTGSLYVAMEALVAKGVLDAEDAKHLRASYEFLRNTEHRLQMAADRQTQQLPSSEQEKLRLAGSMWFATWWEFDAELDRRRTYVHDQFSKILAESEGEKDSEEQLLGNLIHGGLEDVEALSELQAMGLRSAESIPGLLRGFRGGRLYQAYSSIERDRIDRLLPMALETMKSHADASRSLSGFINVIEAIGRRTAYLSLLIENPVALSQLLRLCGASPWISNHIGNNPVVLDELLHPIVDIRNRSRSDLAVELDARLAQVEENDEEARMNTLREFHHAQVLRIAAADVSGVLDVDDVHGALTDLGEVLLQVVFGDAVQFASRKLGKPPGDAGVIAYGKFASRELGYYSDLDLVVCYREAGATQASAAEREYYYARAGRRFIHLVTTRTSSGVLYEIDMRLRPSGRSGTLVSSLDGFFDYQKSSAWTWEHQALVRARVVVGSDDFRGAFESQRREILCGERGLEALKADVVSMREKMIAANCQSTDELYDLKLDEGGIVDIEFLVQYWVLANAAAHPALTIPRGNVEILGALGKAGIISQQDADQLGACYRDYLARSLELKLQGRPVLAGQDELADQRRYVSQVWSAAFDG